MARSKEKQAEYNRKYHLQRLWPTCKECGYVARNLPDVGCLECHARTFPPRDWSEPERDILEQHTGRDCMPYLQNRIYHETKVPRSRSSIANKLNTIGIDVYNHQDGYTIGQLAAFIGVHKNTIQNRIKKLGVKNIGRGRLVLITIDDGDRVIESFKVPDKPSYSVDEAMNLLGYGVTGIHNALRAGLPSWTVSTTKGKARRICKETVDRAIEYLKATGHTRVYWRSVVSG